MPRSETITKDVTDGSSHSQEETPDPVLGLDTLETITPEDLDRVLLDAHVPTLLVALAASTGDDSLLLPEFEPSRASASPGIDPTGGLSPETLKRARDAAAKVILARRSDGSLTSNRPLSSEELHHLMQFLTGPVDQQYIPLMEHELNIPRDFGAPGWTLSELDVSRTPRIAVIGAGMSGIIAAHRLKQAGLPHVVFERGSDIGGVWRDNTYPGARLDTSNFTYAYSFYQREGWDDHYSPQADVLAYLNEVVEDLELRESIQFDTTVTGGRFDGETGEWVVEIEHGGEVSTERFDFLFSAVGQLGEPLIPDLVGLDTFAGETWHTARWNHDVDLAGKRVGLIGAGASGFQVVPPLAEQSGSLSVFQRNPSWVFPTTAYGSPRPSALRWLFHNLPNYARYYRFMQFWLNVDGIRHLAVVDPEWQEPGSVSAKNAQVRAGLEAYLQETFANRPDLVEKLTPSYPPFSRRTVRDDGRWSAAMAGENVDLITTPIERVAPEGIVTTDGVLHPLDYIVFATGFRASEFLSHVDLRDAEGRRLSDIWDGDPRAYYGTSVLDFPNLFVVYGPNTNLNTNGSTVLFSETTIEHALDAIKYTLENDYTTIEVRKEANDAINERIDEAANSLAIGASSLDSWYKSKKTGRVSQNWPLTTLEWWNAMKSFSPENYRFGGTSK